MPSHLQLEAGFDDEATPTVSSLGDSTPSSSSSNKRAALESEMAHAKRQKNRMDDALDKVVGYLDSQAKGKKEEVDDGIEKVAKCSQMIQDATVLDTMSPSSHNACVDLIKGKCKSLLDSLTKDKEES